MCSMLMLGRSGGMPPRKILKIRHCEIESASFLTCKHGVAMYISILIAINIVAKVKLKYITAKVKV